MTAQLELRDATLLSASETLGAATTELAAHAPPRALTFRTLSQIGGEVMQHLDALSVAQRTVASGVREAGAALAETVQCASEVDASLAHCIAVDQGASLTEPAERRAA